MENVSERRVATNGIELNIAEQGDGPLVLMLHGFPESWYSWRHQFAPLAAAGYHAVAPDMRGYGKSDKPADISAYNQVEITGVLGKNVEDLEIWSDEDSIEIEVVVPRHVDDLDTELVIKVPSTASVEVETVSASIEVEGLSGAVELETVSGWVRVAGQVSELWAASVSGTIMVASASGSLSPSRFSTSRTSSSRMSPRRRWTSPFRRRS